MRIREAGGGSAGPSTREQVLQSLREHRTLAIIVLAYVALCYLLRLIFGSVSYTHLTLPTTSRV